MTTTRFFNTTGPIQNDIHYSLPALERWNIKEVKNFIHQRKYFVLHAPRQTGKSSCLLALMDHLNNQGDYYSLYINIENAQTARENVAEAMRTVVDEVANQAMWRLNDSWPMEHAQTFLTRSAANAFNSLLHSWCLHLDKPLVLLIDEIDARVGNSLVAV